MPDFIGPGGGCLVGWVLFGWLGIMRRPFVVPTPALPGPGRPDTTGWFVSVLVGIVAGVVGGYYVHQAFSIDHADSAGVLLTFASAFAAARIAADVLDHVVPRASR